MRDQATSDRRLPRRSPPSGDLTRLVYELLDAHDDTVRIAADLSSEECWRAHPAYLRDLQRVGREILASSAAD